MGLGDFDSAIKVGLALTLIIGFIMFGHLTLAPFLWGLGAFFIFGLPYLTSTLRLFQPLFDLAGAVPVFGIFLRDLPDLLAIIVNEIPMQVSDWSGPLSNLIGRGMWGASFGLVIDFGMRLWMVAGSLPARIAVLGTTLFNLFMVLMLMTYQLADVTSNILPSFEAIKTGIYPIMIPVILIATFFLNIVMFVFPIYMALRKRGGGMEALKDNARDILFAMLVAGIFSFRVWIPVAAKVFAGGAGGTIVNPW
jgi:hypothetical protein